ncbi:uncharacterized protein LOC111246962 [Varroa destructor]|uniref:F5/8 type C domain-containing protein n=1 Tax=Varroa destructor TaxID=109461 RepID=A0A7M7JJK4_VARDE|nr:uncharacterized protein LOC111246962 [Varroa destructor]
MEIGKTLNFELVITIPPTERLDLLLDIFTKDVVADSYNPVLGIFNIVVDIPPEVTLSLGEPQISKMLSGQQDSNIYDRVLVNFGDIINPDTPRKIVVLFSVTAARIMSTFKLHYVTIGAEYDFERFVWISQTEVNVQNAKSNEDEKLVEADYDGPKEIAMDSAGIFTVDAFIKLRSDRVEILVEGPTNFEDVISVGNLGITGFGAHFQSVPQDVVHYRTVKTPSATKDSFIKASIDMGILTNTGSMYQKPRTSNSENKMSFTFGLFALTRDDTIGSEESFKITIDVAGKILWQETVRVNITQRNDNETVNNIEDSRVAIAPPRALLGNLLQYEVHLNLTPSAFTEIYVVQEFDPTNPITLCSGRFAPDKNGFNVVWANSTSARAIITSNPDEIALDLGRLYVSEQRSGVTDMENTAVLELFFFVDPDAADSTAPKGSDGENFQPVKVRIGRRDDPLVVSVEPLAIESKRFVNTLDVRTEDAVTWREIYVGGAVAYDIIISLPLGAFYTNLSLSVTDLSNIQLPGAHICRARVSHIGRNLPCAQSQRDLINENSIFYSKIQQERDDFDSVFVQFDRLCQLAQSPGNQTESQVIINVVASLQGEQSFQNGQPYALHTVVSLNNKPIHQEDKKFNAARPPSKDFLKNQPAYVYFTSLSPSFVPGGVGEVEIVLKTPPKSMAAYLIELLTNDPDVSVCILKIKSIGDSMPCIERDTPADYILHQDSDNGNRKASLAIDALANVGTYPMKQGHFLDPNSLVFSAFVKVGTRATRNKSLKLKISYGSKGQIENTIALPVANVHNTTGLLTSSGSATSPRTILLAPSEPALTSLAPGSVALVTLTVELVEFSSSRLQFDLILDDGVVRGKDIEVCHEGISHLGRNYPCSAPQQWTKHEEGENLLGRYDLGLLCNSFIERNKPEDNYVRFTVPVMLKTDAKYVEGTSLALSSLVVSSGGKEQQNLQFNIAKKAEQSIGNVFPPAVKASSSEESIGIRQRRWIPFNITVPKGAMTEITVTVQGAKTDKVAIVVVHDLRIATVGRNIPCYRPSKLDVALFSSFKNVQNDKAQAFLGYFANPGYSHVRERFQQGDDDIVLEVYVELTDHEFTNDGSKHPVNIQVEMSGWRGTAQQEMTIVRTGKEATSIDVKLSVDNTRPFERGDTISVMAELRHFVSSLMEPTKVALRIFLPQFVTFGGVTEIRSGSGYQAEVKNASNGVDIIFPKLLFADEIKVNMTLVSDPENRRGYGTGVIDATSLYRVECEYTPRKDQTFEPFCSDQLFLAYKVNSDECVLNLGMEDGTIKDCQITASSAVDFEHAPFRVRKGSPQVWSPGIREGMAQPYLDIAFLRVTRVSQLEMIYVPGTRRVHRYRLQASNDGRNWWNHLQTRTLVYQNGVAIDRLPNAVQARHLRIIVVDAADEHVKDELNVGLQIELYGCYIGPYSKDEGCPEDTTLYTNLETLKTRHMTVDTNTDTAYFCDFTDARFVIVKNRIFVFFT